MPLSGEAVEGCGHLDTLVLSPLGVGADLGQCESCSEKIMLNPLHHTRGPQT